MSNRWSWESLKEADRKNIGLGSTFFLIFLICVVIAIKPFEPPDDLLRHLISYLHGYDYRKMYVYAHYPSFNMYMGFDWLVGFVHQSAGYYSFIIIQIADIVLFSCAFLYLLRGVEGNLRAALLLVALYAIFSRLMLGRPSSFESSLMLLGFALAKDERMPKITHLFLGALMVPLYYLFPVYVIPLMLVSWIYGVVLLAGLAFWHLVTDGAYWSVALSVLLSGTAGRVTEISELKGIAPALFQLLFAVVPGVVFFKKEKKTGLAALWFLLPNQVRYLETAVPLLVSMAQNFKFRPTQLQIAILLGLVLNIAIGISSSGSGEKGHYLKGAFPSGSRVFVTTMKPAVQYSNPYILYAPGFEPEWLDAGLRSSYVKITQTGKFDCSLLKKYKFDYVVDTNLKNAPSCLQLKDVAGSYRIWVPTPEFARGSLEQIPAQGAVRR